MNRAYTAIISGIATAASFFEPSVAFAAIGNSLSGGATAVESVGANAGLSTAGDLPTILGKGISVVLGILGIAFIVLVVYAGFLYLTAQGVEENTKKAKKLLTQGVIGMVIIVSAYAISGYVIAAIIKIST